MSERNGPGNGQGPEQHNKRDSEPEAAQPSAAAASKPYIMPDDPEPSDEMVKELTETKDRLLRTLAEMENLRRRTAREVADARSYGIANFARDVLDIADNLQRALDAVPAEAKASGDGGLMGLIEGVELTERSLVKMLEKNGVKSFDPMGERFDPNREQAMYEVPDASVTAGTVVQVMQPGYMIGERVLRPAMVGIAKGGAKAPPREATESENSGEQA